MARYKLTLAYDGAAFSGSQRQARRRTVQAELEQAVRRLGWRGSSVVLAGRTDAGVHAAGQVAAVDLEWAHDEQSLRDAINAALPREVVVTASASRRRGLPPALRCRSHDATATTCVVGRSGTRWTIVLSGVSGPPWSVSALDRAARLVLGTHDFGAFGSAATQGRAHASGRSRHSAWSSVGGVLQLRDRGRRLSLPDGEAACFLAGRRGSGQVF